MDLPKFCPGCGRIMRGSGRCAACRKRYETDRRRREGTTGQRGYDAEWARLSREIRARFPVCQVCGVRPSEQTDHVIPLKDGGPRLDPNNCRAVCRRCHSRATAKSSRGFGGRR
jgi:5-methylcytosine-specific restriction endonuclease McrA